MLTPDDVRKALADLPEDLARRSNEIAVVFTVGHKPGRDEVQLPPSGWSCGLDAIFLYAESGMLESADFISRSSSPEEVLQHISGLVASFERTYKLAESDA